MAGKNKNLKLFKQLKERAQRLAKEGFIRHNSDSFTGINIGSSSIKGLTVRQGKITDFFIEPKRDISETIEILKKEGRTAGKKIRVSLKDPSCLVRYFPFPKTDRKKIKQAIYYQLNKLIPYSPEEVCFDYAVLKETSPSQNYLLLAVAKKDYIQKILDAFEKKGLLVSEITLDSISLINLYLCRYGKDTAINSCVLDIGYSFSTINILEKGVPFLSREAKFNIKDIVDIISRIKNINEKEAVKALFSLDRKSDLFGILEENISDWCKEIKNSFDFFELNRGDNLNKLYITGGLAKISAIAGIFSENLEIDSEILIPKETAGLKFSDSFPEEKYKEYAHNLAVCFGLIL